MNNVKKLKLSLYILSSTAYILSGCGTNEKNRTLIFRHFSQKINNELEKYKNNNKHKDEITQLIEELINQEINYLEDNSYVKIK